MHMTEEEIIGILHEDAALFLNTGNYYYLQGYLGRLRGQYTFEEFHVDSSIFLMGWEDCEGDLKDDS